MTKEHKSSWTNNIFLAIGYGIIAFILWNVIWVLFLEFFRFFNSDVDYYIFLFILILFVYLVSKIFYKQKKEPLLYAGNAYFYTNSFNDSVKKNSIIMYNEKGDKFKVEI